PPAHTLPGPGVSNESRKDLSTKQISASRVIISALTDDFHETPIFDCGCCGTSRFTFSFATFYIPLFTRSCRGLVHRQTTNNIDLKQTKKSKIKNYDLPHPQPLFIGGFLFLLSPKTNNYERAVCFHTAGFSRFCIEC
ncbi:MAG: hypothetical protein ACI8RD_009162, partial [Bacillariaceae sp.]